MGRTVARANSRALQWCNERAKRSPMGFSALSEARKARASKGKLSPKYIAWTPHSARQRRSATLFVPPKVPHASFPAVAPSSAADFRLSQCSSRSARPPHSTLFPSVPPQPSWRPPLPLPHSAPSDNAGWSTSWAHAQLRRGFLSDLGFTANYRIWLAPWNNSERRLAPALHVRIIAKSWSHSSPRLEERENPAPGSSEGGDH